jgi:type I restriction enzyme R subunit
LIEAAELDEAQEQRLERELGRQYHLITRDDRLDAIAKDIVQHFLGRGFQGKAMVVSIDKATALRMHDKVQKHWQTERARVEKQLAKAESYSSLADLGSVAELKERFRVLTTTDMAVVVSPGQNEIEQMRRFGLDIVPHRKRMNEEPLDDKFKDPDDPLRLVFVCAMWLTGFDAPSCSTIYLDKPMRNHTLMQTVARANRVFPGKHSGLIVDYANVFASLEKALAIYGKGSGGATPVRDKRELVEDLRRAVDAALVFCLGHGVDIQAIAGLPTGDLSRLTALADAVDRLIAPDPVRKDFLAHERLVHALYQAVKPDPAVAEFAARVACLAVIGDEIRQRTNPGPPDISRIMSQINSLLDASIEADGFRISAVRERPDGSPAVIDISAIDFEALAKRFEKTNRKNIELERLKLAVRAQLEKMVRANPTRVDYLAKFEELIEAYNNGSRNIDDLFRELLALTRTLTDEQQRHVREQLTEEQLTVFDLLTRPGPELTTAEREEVKKVVCHLLERVRTALVLNWRQKAQARARVKLVIEDTLDEGLPRAYTPELYAAKCTRLFEHVYERFA